MCIRDSIKDELAKAGDIIVSAKDAGYAKFIGEIIKDANMDILRALADKVKIKGEPAVVVLAARSDDKVSFVVSVTDDIIKKGVLDANFLAKEMAKYLNGSGGGRPDFAQGGGKDPSRLEESLKKIYDVVNERCRI